MCVRTSGGSESASGEMPGSPSDKVNEGGEEAEEAADDSRANMREPESEGNVGGGASLAGRPLPTPCPT